MDWRKFFEVANAVMRRFVLFVPVNEEATYR
jgi:hypothetical protein